MIKYNVLLFALIAFSCSAPGPQSTLDSHLQDRAATSLEKQLIAQEADCGTVIVMDVATGEVKVLVNLTRQADSVTVSPVNYATAWLYEPGSTFKTASYIALLEDGVLPDEMVDCQNGQAIIAGQRVADDHEMGTVTLREAFNKRSNVAFAKEVYKTYKDKPEAFVRQITRLFPDIANVAPANIPAAPHAQALVKMGYGYGVQVTPMHILALHNAIANDGIYVSPALVTGKTESGRMICSDDVLAELQQYLNAYDLFEREGMDWFGDYGARGSVATTQLPFGNGRYADESGSRQYYASCVGYFPADSPKYTVFVGIKTCFGNGRYRTYYGASLAMPVFVSVARELSGKPQTDSE